MFKVLVHTLSSLYLIEYLRVRSLTTGWLFGILAVHQTLNTATAAGVLFELYKLRLESFFIRIVWLLFCTYKFISSPSKVAGIQNFGCDFVLIDTYPSVVNPSIVL